MKKRYFNQINNQIVPLKDGDETGLYYIECEDQQQYLNSGCPDNLVLENNTIRWKTDEEKQQQLLNNSNIFSQIQIIRALKALGEIQKLRVLLSNSVDFNEEWLVADYIDLNDPLTSQALEQVDINIEDVKKQILGI